MKYKKYEPWLYLSPTLLVLLLVFAYPVVRLVMLRKGRWSL